MGRSKRNLNLFTLAIVGLMLALTAPAVFGQGRGRGRGHSGGYSDKKCLKFRNCHDASEGRWDNRGPRGTRVGNRILNGGIFNTGRRSRRIDRDGDGDFDRYDILLGRRNRRINRDDRLYLPLDRNGRVDRDGDGDFDRNDVLLGRRARGRRAYRGY